MTDQALGTAAPLPQVGRDVGRDEAPARLVIAPGTTARNYWRDLWRYRELFYFLAWRDIVVRYKQTVIGVAWALIRPALTMLVFVVFRQARGASEHHRARARHRARRHAAVAVLLERAVGILGQPDRQRQPDLARSIFRA